MSNFLSAATIARALADDGFTADETLMGGYERSRELIILIVKDHDGTCHVTSYNVFKKDFRHAPYVDCLTPQQARYVGAALATIA